MRRLALLALLALAASACSVKVEGAACTAAENCPGGQACGHDGRCSKEAVGCGPICREDACVGETPWRCEVAANGICASLVGQTACAGANHCLFSSGRADCVSVALTGPANGTVVAPAGATVAVTATFTAASPGYPAPATLSLTADGAAAATLGSPSLDPTGTITTYAGTYAPVGGTEKEVALQAAAGAIASATRTVSVDTRPPVISAPAAGCTPAPCLRDGVVDVSATVTEGNPGQVKASLDLDGHQATVTLTPGAGGSYTGQLPLASWGFPGFSHSVTVRLTSTDARGNVAGPQEVVVGGGEVTRARAAYAPGSNPITSPAILSNGNAVACIGSATAPAAGATDQARAMAPDGTEAWKQTLAVNTGLGYPASAAPSAGGGSLFAASNDGRVYLLNADGSLPAGTNHMPTGTNLNQQVGSLATPWLRTAAGVDHAFTAGSALRLYQLWSDQTSAAAVTEAASAPGVWSGARVVLVTGVAGATLRRFTDDASAPTADGTLALTDGAGTPAACDKVSVPLAVDGAGFVVIACDNGQVHRIDAAAVALAAGYLGLLPAAPSGSPVVLPSGDYLVPLADGRIARVFNPATAPTFFAWSLVPGEVVRGLAVAGPQAIYATTSGGKLLLMTDTALVVWMASLGASALDFPTIAPVPAGAPAGALPTLLVGSAEGKLFRVVVEAPLDDTAPWPKAHHDVRNTGNPATPVNGP